MKVITLIYSVVGIFFTHLEDATSFCSSSGDPCTQAATLFEPYARTENCKHDGQHSPCDRYITPGWYEADHPILDQCPGLLSCGAVYPVWFNGSLPSVGDGVVTDKLCKTGFSDCCSRTYDIQIKNCGTRYVYCLPALDACPERICFGSNGTCEYPTTTAPTTTGKNVPSKEYDDLKSKYVVAIVAVVVLVLVLAAISGAVAYYIYRKRKREREVCQSRIVLVEEESHRTTTPVEDPTHTTNPVEGQTAPPYLQFQPRKFRQ